MKFRFVVRPLQLVLGGLLVLAGVWIFVIGFHSVDLLVFGSGTVLIGIRCCIKSTDKDAHVLTPVAAVRERARKVRAEWASALRVGCLAMIVLMILVILVFHKWLSSRGTSFIEYIMIASFAVFVLLQFSETMFSLFDYFKRAIKKSM